MNRVLYQLSYAAMWSIDLGTAEISFVIISTGFQFVKRNVCIFKHFLEMLLPWRDIYEALEKNAPVFPGWLRLYGVGAPLAGLEPWQYVPGRWFRVFVARTAAKTAAVAAAAGTVARLRIMASARVKDNNFFIVFFLSHFCWFAL